MRPSKHRQFQKRVLGSRRKVVIRVVMLTLKSSRRRESNEVVCTNAPRMSIVVAESTHCAVNDAASTKKQLGVV